VAARRTSRFLSAAVRAGRCGPGGTDDRGDDAVPGCGDDGRADGVVPGRIGNGDGIGGDQGGVGVVSMAKEEQDGTIPGCDGEGRAHVMVLRRGDSVEAVGVAAAWT
jgi:hypothetical protein